MIRGVKNSWLRFLQVLHIVAILTIAGNFIVYANDALEKLNKNEVVFFYPTYDVDTVNMYLPNTKIKKVVDDMNKTANFMLSLSLSENEILHSKNLIKNIAEVNGIKNFFDYQVEILAKRMPFDKFSKVIDSINIPLSVDYGDGLNANMLRFHLSDEDIKKIQNELSTKMPIGYQYQINFNGVFGYPQFYIAPSKAPFDILAFSIQPKIPFIAKTKLIFHTLIIFVAWYFIGIAIFGVISTILIYIFKGKLVLNPYYAFQKPKEPTP